MDVREKLLGLIAKAKYIYANDYSDHTEYEYIADTLLDNGVTVQVEAKLYWKPVKPGEWNLTCSACDSHLGCRENANFCPECGAKFVYPKAVTPQPRCHQQLLAGEEDKHD